MYDIKVEPERRLLRVSVSGFWSVPTVTDFARDLAPHVAALGPPWGSHRILCDFSGAELVTQPVVNALQDLIVTATVKADRIAYFSSSALARMQLRRIASVRDEIRLFDKLDAAEAWVTE